VKDVLEAQFNSLHDRQKVLEFSSMVLTTPAPYCTISVSIIIVIYAFLSCNTVVPSEVAKCVRHTTTLDGIHHDMSTELDEDHLQVTVPEVKSNMEAQNGKTEGTGVFNIFTLSSTLCKIIPVKGSLNHDNRNQVKHTGRWVGV